MKIIIGLGNPGQKYKSTRHNVGFIAIDAIARSLGLKWEENKKFKAEIIKNGNTILIKPLTFMNESGKSVKDFLSFYKLLKKDLSETLTVIHDDLDLTLGKYKKSLDSRSAGHNGVQSIINEIGTKNFARIRIGIGRSDIIPADKYVLEKFKPEEIKIINETIIKISDLL